LLFFLNFKFFITKVVAQVLTQNSKFVNFPNYVGRE